MKSAVRCCLSIAIILFVASNGFGQDEKPDARLQQPVTIDCVNVRLHTALDMISEQTGVRLNCGRNKDDWQVRDIPVVVCAKDIPLGKLLQTIADVTHLKLNSEKIKDGKSYRIWLDRTTTQINSDYEAAKRLWERKDWAWTWDVNTRLKDIPESTFDSLREPWRDPLVDPQFRRMSEIASLLGPETRDRVLSGEKVKITVKDTSGRLKNVLDEYMRGAWANACKESPESCEGKTTPTDEDFQKASLSMEFIEPYDDDSVWSNPSDSERAFIDFRGVGSMQLRHTGMCPAGWLITFTKGYEFPKKPEPPVKPKSLEVPDTKFDSEFWKMKIALEAPKGKEQFSYADIVSAVSNATGYTIVEEDFRSQKGTLSKSAFPSDTNPRDSLGKWWYIGWSIDEQNKTLVGCEKDWRILHRGLIPERTYNYLVAKLNSDGVDVDDVAQLAQFTQLQLKEWVDASELSVLFYSLSGRQDKQIWVFYNNLTPAQKAKAKSEQGLPMAETDLVAFSNILQKPDDLHIARYESGMRWGLDESHPLTTDPQSVAGMVMWTSPEIVDTLSIIDN